MTTTRVFSAMAAALVVALAGCASQSQNTPAKNATSATSAGLVAQAPPKIITGQSAGNPTLRLKFGEPVTFQRDGVSFTVIPRSLARIDGVPLGLDGQIVNCGLWWRVDQTWIIDVQQHHPWYSWERDFQGVFGLFSESKDAEHGFYNDIATSAISREPDDLGKALSNAARGWDRKGVLHFDQTGPQYLAGCKLNRGADAEKSGEQFSPDDRPITEVQLILPAAEDQTPQSWPTLAIWTP